MEQSGQGTAGLSYIFSYKKEQQELPFYHASNLFQGPKDGEEESMSMRLKSGLSLADVASRQGAVIEPMPDPGWNIVIALEVKVIQFNQMLFPKYFFV